MEYLIINNLLLVIADLTFNLFAFLDIDYFRLSTENSAVFEGVYKLLILVLDVVILLPICFLNSMNCYDKS